MLYTVQGKKTALFYLFQATGGPWRRQTQIVKYSVGNYLAGWNATTSWLVIPVYDTEQEDFLGCYMAGNVMCFRSGEEDMKIPGSVADSSGCHIPFSLTAAVFVSSAKRRNPICEWRHTRLSASINTW